MISHSPRPNTTYTGNLKQMKADTQEVKAHKENNLILSLHKLCFNCEI